MKLASVRAAVFLTAGGAYMIGEKRAAQMENPINYAQWLVIICRNKKIMGRSDAVQLLVAYILRIEAGRYI